MPLQGHGGNLVFRTRFWRLTMSGNITAALQSLAAEINELNALDQGEHRSRQVAMGHKLIAVREILREQNGIRIHAPRGPDGKKPPIGWGEWVTANLTFPISHATRCIRVAVYPEKAFAHNAQEMVRSRDGRRALGSLRAWQTFTDENKRKIVEFVFARWQEERTQA